MKFYDNTRISAFKKCPRFFYYRHVRDWTRGTNSALVFGGAWHEAMDCVWALLCDKETSHTTEEIVDRAMVEFMGKWYKDGMENPEEMDSIDLDNLRTNRPDIAREMLFEYIGTRRNLLQRDDFTLLEIEKPFAVPLDPNDPSLFYVGRIDKTFDFQGNIIAGEHKTTSLYSKSTGIRPQYLSSYSPNSQIDGYLYAGNIEFGPRFKSIWIDIALKHKTIHDTFVFLPIERQNTHLDSWLWEIHYWIGQIEANKEALMITESERGQQKYMAAFPKNTNSCMDFNTECTFMDLCKMWTNPTEKETPNGFKEEKWEPFNILNLESIGLEQETDHA